MGKRGTDVHLFRIQFFKLETLLGTRRNCTQYKFTEPVLQECVIGELLPDIQYDTVLSQETGKVGTNNRSWSYDLLDNRRTPEPTHCVDSP